MKTIGRREFIMTSGAGLSGAIVVGPKSVWPDERAMARAEQSTDSFDLLRAEQAVRRGELFEPADYNRLPLSWHKDKTRALKAQARERGVDGGILLTRRWNIIYATGLWHSGTERSLSCFLPMDQDDGVIWFHPYLDYELVRTWWSTDQYVYFDHHHAEGGFPNEGQVNQGPTVNLYRWWGETLADLGYGNKTIGVDGNGAVEIGLLPGQYSSGQLNMSGDYDAPQPFRPTGGSLGDVASAMPEAQFVDLADIFVRNRMVKGEMENRLAQRSEDIWSEVHAFARNYVMERGPGVVDQEIQNAAYMWGLDRVMQGIEQSGEPHNAVGITFGLMVKSGRTTGYPHPNQMSFAPIERGRSFSIIAWGGIGGYGGEQYRSFLVGPWTEWQEKVWDVHTRAHLIQAEQSFEGNTCSNVAKAVHDYQVSQGMGHLVYHRPGHGSGSEGHQPPYHALGDYTVLQRGMHFSNEPGLYDPENGFGFNHSNLIVVDQEKGLQLGTAPVSKEWCLLEL
jgi:Xaa-Pro aminopeptidase